MPRLKGAKSAETFLKIRGIKVLIDTNVLMLADQASKKPRENIAKFCDQNSMYICDTVFFESLRNMNHKKFRLRREAIRRWTKEIIPEHGPNVAATFEIVSCVYLYLLRSSPKKFFDINVQDLWIISAALSGDVYTILTRDDSLDFHPAIFESTKFCLGLKTYATLKVINLDKLADIWGEIIAKDKITVAVDTEYRKNLLERLKQKKPKD